MQSLDFTVLIASSIPGRVRLSLPELNFFGREKTLQEMLQSITGVRESRLAKTARSLVIYYDQHQTSSAQIVAQVKSALPRVAALSVDLGLPAFSSWGKNQKRLWGGLLIVLGLILIIAPFIPGLPIFLLGLQVLS